MWHRDLKHSLCEAKSSTNTSLYMIGSFNLSSNRDDGLTSQSTAIAVSHCWYACTPESMRRRATLMQVLESCCPRDDRMRPQKINGKAAISGQSNQSSQVQHRHDRTWRSRARLVSWYRWLILCMIVPIIWSVRRIGEIDKIVLKVIITLSLLVSLDVQSSTSGLFPTCL